MMQQGDFIRGVLQLNPQMFCSSSSSIPTSSENGFQRTIMELEKREGPGSNKENRKEDTLPAKGKRLIFSPQADSSNKGQFPGLTSTPIQTSTPFSLVFKPNENKSNQNMSVSDQGFSLVLQLKDSSTATAAPAAANSIPFPFLHQIQANMHVNNVPVNEECVASSSASAHSASASGHVSGGRGASRSSDSRRRATKHSVPENQKDDRYWVKRMRNNEAAKKSRETKRFFFVLYLC